jgi:hypothetical protein
VKRRDFLKASLAAFVSAMVPMERENQAKGDALVTGGYVAEEENHLHYLITQGIMVFDDGIVGMLFNDLVMTVKISQKNDRPAGPNVDCMFGRVIAPLPVSTVFYAELGDAERAKKNVLKIGVIKDDKTSLWFKLACPLIDSCGPSVVTVDTKNPLDGMSITEFTHLTARSEPEIIQKPDVTPTPVSDQRLKRANPNWPNVIDMHEHLVDAWRQYDRNKV